MNKKYISLTIVLLLAIGTLPAIFGQTHEEIENIEIPIFDCYQIKMLQSDSAILNAGDTPKLYYPPAVLNDCWYLLELQGTTECGNCIPNWEIGIGFKDLPEGIDFIQLDENDEYVLEFFGREDCGSVKEELLFPGILLNYVTHVRVENKPLDDYLACPIEFSWELYSICSCEKGKQALYPKVDIEQFSVTGGSTVIKDGKILSGFNVVPGVQQTMIQVENRGFFTQNDAKVKFLGLPKGVTVEITPNTQKIKAHKLGTYQATFTVGADVPSGTYKVAMIAYSDKGVFDTIQMDLIVP